MKLNYEIIILSLIFSSSHQLSAKGQKKLCQQSLLNYSANKTNNEKLCHCYEKNMALILSDKTNKPYKINYIFENTIKSAEEKNLKSIFINCIANYDFDMTKRSIDSINIRKKSKAIKK